jgi:hypothetical protein
MNISDFSLVVNFFLKKRANEWRRREADSKSVAKSLALFLPFRQPTGIPSGSFQSKKIVEKVENCACFSEKGTFARETNWTGGASRKKNFFCRLHDFL